jgi:hypothetical protein
MQYLCINRKACATLIEGDIGHDLGVLDEEYDRPHEDVEVVGIFKKFHTSRKKGLNNAAREVVVSIFICFP